MELVESLAALAHPQRLKIFRLLVRRYPDAVPSGEIARALDLPANSCSVYLSALKAAGLAQSIRTGTSVGYKLDQTGASTLTTDLLADCCRGRPDLCPNIIPAPKERATMPRRFNVLFVCTGNSARSIIAEAVLNMEGGDRFVAYSAGTTPQTDINPFVRELLDDKGIDTSVLSSKSVDQFAAADAPELDFVFTVCDHAANEECPLWPGQPMTAHWGMPDPAKATGTKAQKRLAYQETYGLLRNRLRAFTALPVETLDRLSLQSAFDRIGRLSE